MFGLPVRYENKGYNHRSHDSARTHPVLMIRLTRINKTPIVLNSDLIEHVETAPDTIVSLTSGQKFVVLESAEELIARVIEFRRKINGPIEARVLA